MRRILNGWRRMGLALVGLWVIAVAAFAFHEWAPPKEGFAKGIFVVHAIPEGTEIKGDVVNLPDGRSVKIDNRDLVSGRSLSPWEIDWRTQTNVPKIRAIRWDNVVFFAVLLPLLIWVLVEIARIVVSWVGRGFKSGAS